MTEKQVDYQILNARFHEEEAKIIEKAGQVGRVTIATNMAGRGTDILLDEQVRVKRWTACHRDRTAQLQTH